MKANRLHISRVMILVLAIPLLFSLSELPRPVYATPAVDTSCATYAGGTGSCTLTGMASNVLVVASVFFYSGSQPTITSMTIGGGAASSLTNSSSQSIPSGYGKIGIWYKYMTSGGDTSCSVTASAGYVDLMCSSFSDTPSSAPFFEGTQTATGTTSSSAFTTPTIASGSSGRLVFGTGAAGTNHGTISTDSPFTLIQSIYSGWPQWAATGYYATQGSTSETFHSGTTGDQGYCAAITGILQAPFYDRVQTARGVQDSGTSIIITLGSAPTNGNTEILTVSWINRYSTSVVQTNVTWSQVVTKLQGTARSEIWIGAVSASASTTITITADSGSAAGVANVCEYSSGLLVVDETATNGGTTTPTDTGTTGTTTRSDEVWVGSITVVGGTNPTQTSPTNEFTLIDGAYTMNLGTYVGNAYLEKIVASTGTANSGTTIASAASYWAGAIATFKASSTSMTVSTSGLGTGYYATLTYYNTTNTLTTRHLSGTGGNSSVTDSMYIGTSLVISGSVSGIANQRWITTNTTTQTIPYPGATWAFIYRAQWNPTITLTGTTASLTVSITARTANGTSATASGLYTSWSNWCDNNTALTFSDINTGGGSSTERLHTISTRSWTVTSAIAETITYIPQWKPTVTLTGTTSGLTVSITVRTLDGSSATASGLYSSWSDWCDDSTTLTFSESNTGGGSGTERLHTVSTRSWTVTSAFSAAITYYHQWKPTITLTGTTSSLVVDITTYTVDGSVGQWMSIYASWSSWCDSSTTLTFSTSNTGGGSGTERLHTTSTVSWSVTSAFSATITYLHQWKPLITLTGTTASLTVSITVRTLDGSSNTPSGLYSNWQDWCDDSTTLTFSTSNTGGGSGTERLHTVSTVSWSVTSAFGTTITYIHQWKPTITLAGTSATYNVSITARTLDGSPATASGLYTSWSDWCDTSTTLTFSDGLPGLTTSDTRSWSVTSAFSATITYTVIPFLYSLSTTPAVAFDNECGNHAAPSGSSGSISCSLTHQANALVIVAIYNRFSSGGVTAVTIGGVAATNLLNATNTGREYIFYLFRSSSGAETVSVSWDVSVGIAFVATSYVNTITSAPFFEGTTSATGTSTSASVSIASGTEGRMVVNFVGAVDTSTTVTIAPGSGQTERGEQDVTYVAGSLTDSIEVNDNSTSTARSMTATISQSIPWVSIVTAIKPKPSGTVSVLVGDSVTNTIGATWIQGLTQSVSLSCKSGLPAGASCNFVPASGNPTFSSTLTISTIESTPFGSYTIVVAGASSGVEEQTTSFTLNVFDYSLTNTGNIGVTVGYHGSNTIITTLLGGPTQTVTLECYSGLPTGASCSFSSASGGPTFTSVLTVSTTGATPVGSYTIVVNGTVTGGSWRSTSFSFTVQSYTPPDQPSVENSCSAYSVGMDMTLHCDLNHAAKALILVTAGFNPTEYLSEVYLNSTYNDHTPMSLLRMDNGTAANAWTGIAVYYIYVSTAETDGLYVVWGGTAGQGVTTMQAISILDTIAVVPGSSVWFEDTVNASGHVSGSGTVANATVTVAAGSTYRLPFWVHEFKYFHEPEAGQSCPGQTCIETSHAHDAYAGYNFYFSSNGYSTAGSAAKTFYCTDYATGSTYGMDWTAIGFAIIGQGFSYTLANSGSVIVAQGNSGNTTLTATLSSTTGAEPVFLYCESGLPLGASCSFTWQTKVPTFTSLLTISTNSSTPPGSYQMVVNGTSVGATEKFTVFTLVVVEALVLPGAPTYISATVTRHPIVWQNSTQTQVKYIYTGANSGGFNLWAAIILMITPFLAFLFIGFESAGTGEGVVYGAVIGGGLGIIINAHLGNIPQWTPVLIIILLGATIFGKAKGYI